MFFHVLWFSRNIIISWVFSKVLYCLKSVYHPCVFFWVSNHFFHITCSFDKWDHSSLLADASDDKAHQQHFHKETKHSPSKTWVCLSWDFIRSFELWNPCFRLVSLHMRGLMNDWNKCCNIFTLYLLASVFSFNLIVNGNVFHYRVFQLNTGFLSLRTLNQGISCNC